MIINVYVPVKDSYAAGVIRQASAIVGSECETGVKLHFEGDVYGAGMCFDEKLRHAADRHARDLSTRVQLWVTPDEVIKVGTYDTERRALSVTERTYLAAWRGEE